MLDSRSKLNAMTLAYAAYLDFTVRVINIGAQKIDGSLLATYGIVIAAFQVINKLDRSRFFLKIFLLANIRIEVVLGMPFFIFSNADI